jgi:hypothetical protein
MTVTAKSSRLDVLRQRLALLEQERADLQAEIAANSLECEDAVRVELLREDPTRAHDARSEVERIRRRRQTAERKLATNEKNLNAYAKLAAEEQERETVDRRKALARQLVDLEAAERDGWQQALAKLAGLIDFYDEQVQSSIQSVKFFRQQNAADLVGVLQGSRDDARQMVFKLGALAENIVRAAGLDPGPQSSPGRGQNGSWGNTFGQLPSNLGGWAGGGVALAE